MADLRPSPRGRIANSVLPAGLLLHPFECAVAALSVIIAISLGVSALDPSPASLSLVQRVMPFPISLIWGIWLGVGGLLTLAGIFTRSTRKFSIAAEFGGLSLMGAAWAVYSLIILVSAEQNAIVPVYTGAGMVLASLARGYALVLSVRVADRESRRTSTPSE